MIARLHLLLLAVLAGALLARPADASCTASAQYNFAFANQPAGSLAYGSSYTYAAANSAGSTRPFTVALAQDGLLGITIASTQLPAISTLVTGPDATKRDLVIGGIFTSRTADLSSGQRVITVTFTFAQPIRDFAVTLHDVDFTANQYRDWVMLTGSNGSATYVPAMTTPWGNSNATGGARTNASSSVTFGPGSMPYTMPASQAAGTGASGNNSDTGTITANFPQPVTNVTLRYGNGPLTTGEAVSGQQGMGIAGISFCPMPDISVAKTSAPVAGALGAFNTPGNDVTYTLTVTNNGDSPVDAGTIVLTDALPPKVTFKNALLDPVSGLPVSYSAGTSGLALVSGNVAYSNNAGASWAYAPSSGYDPAVTGLRITPTGTMAPNSSFSVSFVAMIK